MKNILFVCSANKLRSPTAEVVFSKHKNLNVESAGLDSRADVCVTDELIEWAELIFVMEKSHKTKLAKNFRPSLKGKKVICLDIPDEYGYMDMALIKILENKVSPFL